MLAAVARVDDGLRGVAPGASGVTRWKARCPTTSSLGVTPTIERMTPASSRRRISSGS